MRLSVPSAGVSLLGVENPRPTEVPLADAFSYPGVASAYQHRPPYPDLVFDVLTGLIIGAPKTVLDLGAGEGALARPLAARVDQVDAVDISAAMIEAGRRRPGGDAANLRWIVGAAGTAPLGGPYALVTAGASMHWMRWPGTLGRLAAVMTDGAFLALAGHSHKDPDGRGEPPWDPELDKVIAHHSRSETLIPTSGSSMGSSKPACSKGSARSRPRRRRSGSAPPTMSSSCTQRRALPGSG
jgi:SAM-dependent methyltransferase